LAICLVLKTAPRDIDRTAKKLHAMNPKRGIDRAWRRQLKRLRKSAEPATISGVARSMVKMRAFEAQGAGL
jgi:hypothetical protein